MATTQRPKSNSRAKAKAGAAKTPRKSRKSASASSQTGKRSTAAQKPPSTRKTSPANRAKSAPPAPARQSAFVRLLTRHWSDVWGVAFIVLGLVAGLAIYFDAAGPLGGGLRDGVSTLIGWGRILVPPAFIVLGVALVRGRTGETIDAVDPQSGHDPDQGVRLGIGGVLVAISTAGLLHLIRFAPVLGDPIEWFRDAGGYAGWLVGAPLRAVLGPWAGGLVLVAIGIVGLVIVTRISLNRWFAGTAAAMSPIGSLFAGSFRSLLGHERVAGVSNPAVVGADHQGEIDLTADATPHVAAGSAPEQLRQPKTAPIMVGGEKVGTFESTTATVPVADQSAAGQGLFDQDGSAARDQRIDPLLPGDALRRSAAHTPRQPLTHQPDAEPFAAKPKPAAKAAPATEPEAPAANVAPVIALRNADKAKEGDAAKPERAMPERAMPKVEVAQPEPVAGKGTQLTMDLGRAVKGTKWKLPKMTLLGGGGTARVDQTAVEDQGRTLERALASHGVDASLVGMVVGPTVTRFELELGEGVKVNKITSLNKDIAYAMASADVRILAPIPGRQAIGVEVPNTDRQIVALGDILRSPAARSAKGPLEVAVGRDINGKSKMVDLAKMPHILIAGATGSGKSSCINSIVTSVLMRCTPEQVRMILVDPKMVEMTQYERVPHLLTAPVTDPKKAANALGWACREMDRRYELLSKVGYRDIGGYNKAHDKAELPPGPADENGEPGVYPRLPLILVVVDELADLMMVAPRDVEDSINRIAAKARAVGIHLVIATQRPSTNVITGVIKANIPARLAFSVSSLTDSRVILDQGGAERLVGKGDMLLLDQSSSVANRIQGCWVEEDEVKAVVAAWRKQVNELDELSEVTAQSIVEPSTGSGGGGSGSDAGSDDELFQQARELVVTSQLGSTSMLQRKLRVGFARAGRLMDLLEEAGIVGPSVGSKAREVLIGPEDL